MMTCEYEGRKYEIRFRHNDKRFLRVAVEKSDGTVKMVALTPLTVKEQKKAGGNSTSVRVLDVTSAEGSPIVLTAATVRHNQADVYNKPHARWYALERALNGLTDPYLRRALWKAYYDKTSWRPDGRDGFKLAWVKWTKGGVRGGVKRELIPWTRTGGFKKVDNLEVVRG